jgi:hypothetical protein
MCHQTSLNLNHLTICNLSILTTLHKTASKMKFTIFTTLIVGACAFSPAPTKPAFSTSLKAKSTPEWFTPAAVAAAGWAVAANVAFAAPAPVVFGKYAV